MARQRARLAAGLRNEAYGRTRDWGLRGTRIAAVACVLALITVAIGAAQTAPDVPKTLPDTTIAPAGGAPPPTEPAGDTEGPDISAPTAPESAPPPPASPATHHRVHHTVAKSAPYNGPVEAGQALLKLTADGWAYTQPATSSSHVERLEAGKFVNVTGSTRHYLRIKLKSGKTAYVPMTAVELARPTDKVFRLTRDTPVLSAPNHSAKRLAEVHNTHDVHVVGTSMNYLKIRMKDGLEGYIVMTALE
ncbi:MAG TPA: hypothetical protein VN742_11725 [Candidatus Binataceae bacterium]|nr:hypothetical protein [Candidatus Binataceae bacterium]